MKEIQCVMRQMRVGGKHTDITLLFPRERIKDIPRLDNDVLVTINAGAYDGEALIKPETVVGVLRAIRMTEKPELVVRVTSKDISTSTLSFLMAVAFK